MIKRLLKKIRQKRLKEKSVEGKMNEAKYNRIVKGIKKREKLQKMADDVGGKVIVSDGKTIIHINAFTYMTEDGTVVHEWP